MSDDLRAEIEKVCEGLRASHVVATEVSEMTWLSDSERGAHAFFAIRCTRWADALEAALSAATPQRSAESYEEGISNLQTLLNHAYDNNRDAYNERDAALAELAALREKVNA